jgi:outer membrane immunogenic protein
MRKLLCASMAALAATLAPAVAADLSVAPIYKVPPLASTNWSGSYIGLSGGGAWGNANVFNGTAGLDATPGFDLRGGLIGITSGMQLQNGAWVLGYEGDTSITSKQGSAVDFPPAVAGTTTDVKERWLSTYRGRIGVAQDNWLLYATAGGALANVQQTVSAPAGTISERHWHWGWTVGAGLEWKMGQDWSAKVEYLYVDLQNKSYFNPAPVPFQSDQRVRLDDHVVRVGVNYKLPWSVLDRFFKR